MGRAKDIVVKPISSSDARKVVKRIHYSGKVVQNSTLHLGVFIDGRCEGAMQFGSPLDKRKVKELVRDTGWNDFLELNRMAFSEKLPKNSESRALSIAFKIIKKNYPHIEWVVSFADGTQCGDGTIYRASGFKLVGVKKNNQILMWKGKTIAKKTLDNTNYPKVNGKYYSRVLIERGEAVPLEGFQLKYVYFLNKDAEDRLTVPVLPFSKIDEMGAGMYKGEKIMRGLAEEQQIPSADGSATLTSTLHIEEAA